MPADGQFCWTLLASADPAGSQRFYGEAFGWESAGASPATFTSGGRSVGALDQLEPPLAANGVPSHWRSFVRVPDADAMVARGRELGGFSPGEPRELADWARVAPLFDPQGANVAAWQPLGDMTLDDSGAAGSIVLFELQARDFAAGRDFYAQLFGWDVVERDAGYATFALDGETVAAVQERDPRWGDAPPLWLPYVRVESSEAAAARMTELGARIVDGPSDHPLGRRVIVHDPQDAVVAVLEPA